MTFVTVSITRKRMKLKSLPIGPCDQVMKDSDGTNVKRSQQRAAMFGTQMFGGMTMKKTVATATSKKDGDTIQQQVENVHNIITNNNNMLHLSERNTMQYINV